MVIQRSLRRSKSTCQKYIRTADVAGQGSRLKPVFVPCGIAGGGRHAQLNASMAPCLAVIVCLVIYAYMTKPVKTSLDSVFAGQSSDQFWKWLSQEATSLCEPTRDCGDSSPHPLFTTNLDANSSQTTSFITTSLVGPNSHCQRSTNKVLFNNVGRAEGCRTELQVLREAVEVSTAETWKLNSPFAHSKRSWVRAVRKAIAFGKVRYKGQWIRLHRISAQDRARACSFSKISSSVAKTSPPVAGSSKVSSPSGGKKIKFALLNRGGLPLEVQDECLLWAENSQLDIIALVETRRRPSSTWVSGAYKIIQCGESSGTGQAYSGIFCGIRGCQQVRYHECIPGRLLRVCIQFDHALLPLGTSACIQQTLAHDKGWR